MYSCLPSFFLICDTKKRHILSFRKTWNDSHFAKFKCRLHELFVCELIGLKNFGWKFSKMRYHNKEKPRREFRSLWRAFDIPMEFRRQIVLRFVSINGPEVTISITLSCIIYRLPSRCAQLPYFLPETRQCIGDITQEAPISSRGRFSA